MKILFKKQLFDLEVKGQGLTKVITVCDTRLMVMHPHTKYNLPIWKDKKVMVSGQASLKRSRRN